MNGALFRKEITFDRAINVELYDVAVRQKN